jgi:hypothetical protein
MSELEVDGGFAMKHKEGWESIMLCGTKKRACPKLKSQNPYTQLQIHRGRLEIIPAEGFERQEDHGSFLE